MLACSLSQVLWHTTSSTLTRSTTPNSIQCIHFWWKWTSTQLATSSSCEKTSILGFFSKDPSLLGLPAGLTCVSAERICGLPLSIPPALALFSCHVKKASRQSDLQMYYAPGFLSLEMKVLAKARCRPLEDFEVIQDDLMCFVTTHFAVLTLRNMFPFLGLPVSNA